MRQTRLLAARRHINNYANTHDQNDMTDSKKYNRKQQEEIIFLHSMMRNHHNMSYSPSIVSDIASRRIA